MTRRSWRTCSTWITPPTIGCWPRTSAAVGIGVHELVFGVPYYRMVNAAFTHPHPFGSRFNGPERGAWYAAFELRTAQAEVAFHKCGAAGRDRRCEEEVTYDDYQADVSAPLHDLRDAPAFGHLSRAGQLCGFAAAGRAAAGGGFAGSDLSERQAPGWDLRGLFRPALVTHLRKGKTWRFRWKGKPLPVIEAAQLSGSRASARRCRRGRFPHPRPT